MPWNAEMRKTNGENLPQEVFFHREGGHDNRHVQRLDVREIGTQQKRPPGSVASSISRSSSFTRPDGGKGRCWVVPLVSEDWLFHLRLLSSGRRVHVVNERLVGYRVHTQSWTSDPDRVALSMWTAFKSQKPGCAIRSVTRPFAS